ncbi:MAG: hypothetical protein ABSE21_07750 [Bryobacteraceae bacterium]
MPDALFCHRCGRPLRPLLKEEEPPEEEQPVAPEPVPSAPDRVVLSVSGPSEAVPVEMRNRIAVRSALVAAALSQLLLNLLPVLSFIPVLGGTFVLLGFFVLILGGGWYASFLFQRRSGEPASLRSGARLGWICGIFSFVISTIFFSLSALALVNSSSALEANRKNAAALGLPADVMDQMMSVIRNPFALVLLLFFLFFLLTAMSSLGGLLHGYSVRRRAR